MERLTIVGTVGLPAKYGGFETLAERLVVYHSKNKLVSDLAVYCSGVESNVESVRDKYLSAELRYINLKANGIQSIFYDIYSLISSVINRADIILVLGVSGCVCLPLIRLFSKAKIITNIDGIEWKRDKWSYAAKLFLRLSEKFAVRFSHIVIADNKGIEDYVRSVYGKPCEVITYGGDHAFDCESVAAVTELSDIELPDSYCLSLCRIEPENNVELILNSFIDFESCHLVFIGNWDVSDYSRKLRRKYANVSNLHLLDPIYDQGILKYIRSRASVYVHGHSAGGTNPSLVEMMHFGTAIFSYDCNFNRYTTFEKAFYFDSIVALQNLLLNFNDLDLNQCGLHMKSLANDHYRWEIVGEKYFSIMTKR